MPHVDGMCLRAGLAQPGQSRFARPVAKVTAAVRTLADRVHAALTRRGAGNGGATSPVPHARIELAVRQLEDYYASATDVHDLERMEREWNRRDGGGMRRWDWR